jgi:dTDP-4-dehydrorhamnose reductase
MPFNLREIASIAGMSGLFRIVKPTRTGVIIESLEEKPTRGVAQARQRISLLDEISIYTTDADNTVPLREVFKRIRQQFGDDLPVHPKSSGAELASFMEEIIPEYDQERVYTSDMKKVVTWYEIVNKFVPYTEEEEKKEEQASAEEEPKTEETTAEAPAAAETATEAPAAEAAANAPAAKDEKKK